MKIDGQVLCDDCGGWDVEWMHRCQKHGTDYCRGCECPECAENAVRDFDEEDDHE